jgi:ATP-dependent Clp protease protease subunit
MITSVDKIECKSSLIQQPVVLEERELKAVAVDIYSRLLMDRIIILGTEIDESTANTIMAQLLYLNAMDNKKPIQMYINSPGGSVVAGLQIYDTMQMIKAPVQTICTGMAASMAAVILAGGEKGMRGALPNSSIMIHQPMGGAVGQASDIAIANERIQFYKSRLYSILSEHTGQTIEQIVKDGDRDCWFTAFDAKKYGIIDKEFDEKNIL